MGQLRLAALYLLALYGHENYTQTLRRSPIRLPAFFISVAAIARLSSNRANTCRAFFVSPMASSSTRLNAIYNRESRSLPMIR